MQLRIFTTQILEANKPIIPKTWIKGIWGWISNFLSLTITTMLRGDLGRLVGYYLPRNIGGKVVPFTTGLNCWRLLVEKGQLQKLKRSPNDTFTIAFKTPPQKKWTKFQLNTMPYGSKHLLRRYKLPPKLYPLHAFQAPDAWIHRDDSWDKQQKTWSLNLSFLHGVFFTSTNCGRCIPG